MGKRRPGRRGWGKIGGSTPQWRRFREAILLRDQFVCQINGPRCLGVATEVDHIKALCDGGAMYDENNARAACRPCNRGRRDYAPVTPGSVIVEQRTVW